MKRALLLFAAIALMFSGCARRKRGATPPPALRVGMEETGMASWYGNPYHGRASASGEIYDMEKLTAAHRTLPFGTVVRIENLDNDATIDVRVNDRGPFVKDRIIDLSRAAAREIRMLGPGTAKVKLRVIELPPADPAAYYAVQAGAFRDRANAERRRKEMETRYGSARLLLRAGNPPLWRVLVGREATEEGADALASRLEAELGDAFVVRVDAPAAH